MIILFYYTVRVYSRVEAQEYPHFPRRVRVYGPEQTRQRELEESLPRFVRVLLLGPGFQCQVFFFFS